MPNLPIPVHPEVPIEPSSTHLWEASVVAVLKMVAYLMTPTMRRVDDVSVVVMMVFDGVWGWWPCGGGRHGCFV